MPLVNRGKDKEPVPLVAITKKQYAVVNTALALSMALDVYVVDKMVNGQKLSQVFSTKEKPSKLLNATNP